MVLRNTEHMSKCEKCRYYCRSGATFLFSHIGLCSLVFGYTVMGAFTFEALEARNEAENRKEIIKETEAIIESLRELTDQSNVLNESKWKDNATHLLSTYEKKLVKAIRKDGFDGHFDESGPLQWSFSGALLYSIIVITTIGYGNIAPKTNAGKIVTILYAIVGIPLLLLCLSNIGDAMAHSFKFIYWKVCCYLCTSPKPQHKKSRSTRPSRYPSGILQSSTTGREYDSLNRKVYGGAAMPNQYDRQKSYMSTLSSQQSMPRNHHTYTAREPNFADAYKVPVISNKYVTNLSENNINSSIHRQHPLHLQSLHSPIDTTASYNSASPFVRQQPKLQQQDLMTSFSGMMNPTELDYEESLSITTDRPEEDEEGEEASVPIMLCIAIVVGYICGGAMLFSYWEDWEYSDSCYFCFITLTTIGFGDMVPGTAVLSEDAQLTLGLCSLYLLFGMALIAMSFNLVQEEVTKSVTSIGKRIGILSEDDDDDDDI